MANDEISEKAEDVTQVAGLFSLAVNVLLGVLLLGLVAVVLDAVEDTTGAEVPLQDLAGRALEALGTVATSMANAVGDLAS